MGNTPLKEYRRNRERSHLQIIKEAKQKQDDKCSPAVHQEVFKQMLENYTKPPDIATPCISLQQVRAIGRISYTSSEQKP